MTATPSAGTAHLAIAQLHDLLTTTCIGSGDRCVYLPMVNSTNTVALELARAGSEEGTVVLTDRQTAGKGRQGRRWLDQAGCNALSSTILRPVFPPYFLVMIAALAVVDTIADISGVVATIKWPNDILIGARKVSGILIETSHDRAGRLVAIVGIGVNVNGQAAQFGNVALEPAREQRGLASTATTLEEECGHPVSREAFLASLLHHLETEYLAVQQEAQHSTVQGDGFCLRQVRERWRNRLSTLGHTIKVRQGDTLLSGVAEDVNEHGELLLRVHSGERISITWGDVG